MNLLQRSILHWDGSAYWVGSGRIFFGPFSFALRKMGNREKVSAAYNRNSPNQINF